MSIFLQMAGDFIPFLTLFYLAGMLVVIPFGYDTALRVVFWPFYIGLDLFDWAEEAREKYKEEHTLHADRPTS